MTTLRDPLIAVAGTRRYLAALTKHGAATLACVALAGCAAGLLPALLVPQMAATVGVAGLAAVSCTGNTSCEPGVSQCTSPHDSKLQITEALDIDVPANEGNVAAFMPAYWQSQFVSQGASVRASAVELAGTFAITDKSIVFAASPGMEGVHLPLIGVVNVEVQQNATTGAPRQLTVESCFGRLDRFTFGQSQQPRQLDSKATTDAAAEIRARIAKARPASPK